MIKYILSENLKHKRTFTRKIILLSPIVTLLIALLSPLWFEVDGYNFWYVIMFPGTITLITILINQKEEKKLSYRAIYTLPVDLKKVWIGKLFLISIYVFLSSIMLLICMNLIGHILKLPLKITILKGFIAVIIMTITTGWQIPFCLFLSKKFKLLGGILINFGLGTLLNIMMADSNMWWISPYSYTSRLMATILQIHPNATPLELESPLINTNNIPVGIIVSLTLYLILLIITANWFQKQEAK